MKLLSRSPADCTPHSLVRLFALRLRFRFRSTAARTDVSGYQTNVVWTTVKNAGVKFAWTKATEGTGFVSDQFRVTGGRRDQRWHLQSGLIIMRGRRITRILQERAAQTVRRDYFWSVAGPYIKYGGAYLMPMLDWEDVNATVAAGFTADQMSAWVNEWCNRGVEPRLLDRRYHQAGRLSTGAWYSRPGSKYPGLTTAVTNHPCCISAYPIATPTTTAEPQIHKWVVQATPTPAKLQFLAVWQYKLVGRRFRCV